MKSEDEQKTMLRELRIKKSVTLRQVADAVGISESMYCLIENGKRRPSPDVAKRIAGFLGFDWTRFYDDKPINEIEKAV